MATTRAQLRNYILEQLGCPTIKVELTDAQIDDAITDAVRRYRDFGSEGTYEAWYILDITAGTQDYTLPANIYDVINVTYQTAARALTTNVIDPYLNIFSANQQQGLTLVEIGTAYLENVQRMFSKVWQFTTRKDLNGQVVLHLIDTVRLTTKIVLHVEQTDDETILLDHPWIKDYAVARSKLILGNIRRRFQTIAGPGGVVLDGQAMVSDAKEEIAELNQRLVDYHRRPVGFVIG